ncbi:hypothetical protein Rcae01_01385 [Novipirellula caenicola]|uniref:Uncharacterized protein n=1 Tax=Novipirellula caenicola TaxID=1536901 RepID=A0ABP9VL58_9BACT
MVGHHDLAGECESSAASRVLRHDYNACVNYRMRPIVSKSALRKFYELTSLHSGGLDCVVCVTPEDPPPTKSIGLHRIPQPARFM